MQLKQTPVGLKRINKGDKQQYIDDVGALLRLPPPAAATDTTPAVPCTTDIDLAIDSISHCSA